MFDGQHRSFHIQTCPNKNETTVVKINETPGVSAENLSLATWGSSYILANKLHEWKDHVVATTTTSIITPDDEEGNENENENDGIPILELGAGTSLVGLSAAAIYHLPVMVTDLEPLIPGLAANIASNPHLAHLVTPGVLDWWHPQSLTVHHHHHHSSPAKKTRYYYTTTTHKTSLILAADTVYDEDHPALLTSTITTWLAPSPNSRVVLCYVLRHTYIDIIRHLWERLEAAGLECIEEGQEDADPDKWDDVAPFEWCVWRWKAETLTTGEGK